MKKTNDNRIAQQNGMKDFLHRWFYAEKKERPAMPRRSVALVVLAACLLFSLYYVGVFDLSLITRPEGWQDHASRFYSIWTEDGADGADTEKTDDETKEPDDEQSPGRVSTIDIKISGKDPQNGATFNTELKTADDLAADGYVMTDSTFVPGASEVGSLSFSFSLPKTFSYRTMATRTWEITKYDDGRMSTVEDTEKTVERPAVYLYMGYIIFDDRGGALYLVDRDGKVLTEYNENFIPAFARDVYGRPLFYTPYGHYAEVPETDEVNEAGEHTYTLRGAYVKGKTYYALVQGGYFIGTDYVEERDGRGLNFDFPASYGLSDNYYLSRSGIMTPRYTSYRDGKAALVNTMMWNYFSVYDENRPNVGEIVEKMKAYEALPTADKLAAIEEKTTPEDIYHLSELFPYLAAYNYREGYATVVTTNVDEDPVYEAEEVRVINTSGDVMFDSRKGFGDEMLSTYCNERFLLPLSKGEESVGHLYFDHGLMRLRKLSYDIFQLEEYHVFRVNSDKDVLVTPNGREFAIPDGYTLKGYSDGVLTLERGGRYGYMRYDGVWITDPEYTNAANFHGGLGVLTRSDGTVGAVDTNGTVVIPFRYEYISNRSDSLIAAYSAERGWELFGIFEKQ